MDDGGDDGDAEEHAPTYAQAEKEVERQHHRHEGAAHVDRDDRHPLLVDRRHDIGAPEHGDALGRQQALDAHRVERDIHVAADQGQKHDDEHVAGRHADLPVGVSEDPQLDHEHEDHEQEQEEAEQEWEGDGKDHRWIAPPRYALGVIPVTRRNVVVK